MLALLDPALLKLKEGDKKPRKVTIREATAILECIFKNRLNLYHEFFSPYATNVCKAG